LITDAAFPNKAAEGKTGDIRYCVSCNSCWRSIIEAGALACDNNPKVGEPDEHLVAPPSVTSRRHVVVVGTGVAALEAAHTAAARGHRVTVLGDHDAFGGKTRLHAEMPGGENLSSVYDYQYLRAQQLGVKFELGRQASIEDVLSCGPDVVLLATGSRSARPEWLPEDWFTHGLIPSLRDMAKQLAQGMGLASGRAVIVDQDHTEMTYATALRMTSYFDQITLVTSRERFANDVSLINRQGILKRLFESHVELICHVEPEGIAQLEEGQFTLRNVYNGKLETLESVATVVHASSRVPNDLLLEPLLTEGLEAIPLGDCKAPRSLMSATREGYDIAKAL
jgi:thioredoxin reductase